MYQLYHITINPLTQQTTTTVLPMNQILNHSRHPHENQHRCHYLQRATGIPMSGNSVGMESSRRTDQRLGTPLLSLRTSEAIRVVCSLRLVLKSEIPSHLWQTWFRLAITIPGAAGACDLATKLPCGIDHCISIKVPSPLYPDICLYICLDMIL